ncbi:MAG: 16S rRNA processing protein RimM [Sphingobium sp.]|nr:16S rRNA processing protein RimM [Sphingobium sp.]
MADTPASPAPASSSTDDRVVLLAAIIGAHGVSGEVRLKLFGDGPDSLKVYQTLQVDGRALTLKSVRAGPNGAVARFAEINGRNEAEALRGAQISVPRSALPALPDGEYYHIDLIDLPCISDEGDALGRIVAVENFGAGDIIEIEQPAEEGKKPKRFMVPMHAAQIEADKAIIAAAFIL